MTVDSERDDFYFKESGRVADSDQLDNDPPQKDHAARLSDFCRRSAEYARALKDRLAELVCRLLILALVLLATVLPRFDKRLLGWAKALESRLAVKRPDHEETP